MSDRSIRELIRHPEPLTATPATTVQAASRAMTDACCGSILVVDAGGLIGIFTERDALNRVLAPGLDAAKVKLAEVMTASPDTIEATAPVSEAIRRMDEFGYRHLPVTDDGRLIGVISIRDLSFTDVAGMQPELDQRHVLTERLR